MCFRLAVIVAAISVATLASASAAAAPLVVDGSNSPLTISADQTVDSLTVQAGAQLVLNAVLTVTGDAIVLGTVTHTEKNPGFALDVAGTLDVRAGGFISGTARGLGGGFNGSAFGGRGEQFNPVSLLTEAGSGAFNGGSHGGVGGLRDGNQVAPSAGWGDQVLPTTFGGGGGQASGCGGGLGGKGGGRIVIVTGDLIVNGTIEANGQDGGGGCPGGGGGAGGSVSITAAGNMSGAGLVRALGGTGLAGGGGGGGGGRVYVSFSTSTYTGGISAAGGAGSPAGTDGSSYVIDSDDDALVVPGGFVRLDGSAAHPSVTLGAGGNLILAGAAAIAAPIDIPAGTRLTIESQTALGNATIASPISGTLRTLAPTSLPATMQVNLGGLLNINDTLNVAGDLILNAGATQTHDVRTVDASLIVSGLIHVRAGAFIDLSGKGLPATRSLDPQSLLEVQTPDFRGGSHGGVGGNGALAGYDDARNPLLPGSGGGNGNCTPFSGAGGGVMNIQANTLLVEGIVRANGTDGGGNCSTGGGGSGGSLRIQVSTFAGNGIVEARGGTTPNTGAGGGGRIAIYYATKSFSGVVSALTSGVGGAEPGTVHMEDASGNLIAQGGTLPLFILDSFQSVTLLTSSNLTIGGPATVSTPIDIVPGATVRLNSVDSLDNIDLVPIIGGTLIVNADTLLPDTTLAGQMILNAPLGIVGDITINAGGVLTHDARVIDAAIDASVSVHVKAGGLIDISSKGLPALRSLDPLTLLEVNTASFIGGSHGGRGGGGALGTYDDPREPRLPGSGGGPGNCTPFSGAGGGVIAITAPLVDIDGIVRADGGDGGGNCSGGGGGAGGSILIDATTFDGTNGVISARGGNTNTGAGGGGRIAIYYTTKLYSGVVSALTPGGGGALAGSVWMEDAAGNLTGEGGFLPLDTGDAYNSVALRQFATLQLNGSADVNNPIDVASGASVELNGTDALNNAVLVPTIAGALHVNDTITLPSSTTLQGTMIVNALLAVNGDLSINAGGVLTHDVRETDAALDVTGQVHVRTGGVIDLNSKGLPGTRSLDPLTLNEVQTPDFRGGSHGGVGGNSALATYDDDRNPRLPGSGGGPANCSWIAGAGGGVLSINATTLRVDGIIRADGGDAGGNCASGGGGSGGSLLFNVSDFRGTNGLISAKGGSAYGGSGAGGGGRIAIYYATKTFTGIISALSHGAVNAQPGTVIVEDQSNNLTAEGGRSSLTLGDTYSSVTLRPFATLSLDGPASVSTPITVAPGTTVEINSSDALSGVTLNPLISGTLVINADVTLPANTTIAGTLIVNQTLRVTGDLTVNSGAVVTHAAGVNGAALDVTGLIHVRSGGTIDLNSRGLAGTVSLDPLTQLTVTTPSFAGGSHGGRGGGSSLGGYDQGRAPVLLGSGGGSANCSWIAGAGGGAMIIDATTLRVDGIIRADGGDGGGNCTSGGGGSGGTLQIHVVNFEGTNGLVSAKGGTAYGGSGAGGGGRIAIFYTTKTFNGVISALSPQTLGAVHGTAHMQDAAGNITAEGGVLPVDQGDTFASATLRPFGILAINGGAVITQPVSIGLGGTVQINSTHALDDVSLNPIIAGQLQVNADITLPQTTTLNGSMILDHELDVTGDLIVNAAAIITHSAQVTTAALDVSNLIDVRTGGTIDLNSRGLPGTVGIDPLSLLTITVPAFTGGGHGGRGGNGGGLPYDDPRAPRLPGSGGGSANCSWVAGAGGGVLRINATTLRLDGIIRADGGDGGGNCTSGGGGSGGSIQVDVIRFEGSAGLLSAKGGSAYGGSGGGAGGRIAVTYAQKTFAGVVSALAAGTLGAEPGTVFMSDTGGNVIVESGTRTIDENDNLTSVELDLGGTLVLAGPAIVDEPISVPAGTTLVISSEDALDNVRIAPEIAGTIIVNADTNIDDSLVLSGTLVVDRILQLGGLEVLQTGLVTHSSGVFTMNLVVNDQLALRAGGRISANGMGFRGGPNSGFGTSGAGIDPLTLLVSAGAGRFNGGNHTTAGGRADGGQPAGALFDDPANPVYGGGGGGQGNCNGNPAGGDGGGVVRVAAGSLVLDGIVSADGNNGGGGGCPGGGGGAGGSVVLSLGSWSGSGALFSRGGNAESGGGAGGVVKVSYASKTYTGVINTAPGTGSVAGSPGVADEGVEDAEPAIVSVPGTDAFVGRVFRYRPFATGAPPMTWSMPEAPAGAVINPSNGEVTWTPTESGTFLFQVHVQNALGSDDQAFALTPIGAPTIVSLPNLTGFVDVAYAYDADARAEAVGDQPITWSTLLAPTGFFIASASGVISWTPDNNGAHGVCIVAANGAGEDVQCFTVIVAPEGPPVFTSVPEVQAEQFRPYEYDDDLAATAFGPPPIVYSLVSGPDEFEIDPVTGVITWVPTIAGDFDVTIRAGNDYGDGDQSFTINVLPEGGDTAPVIVESANLLAAVGLPYIYDEDSVVSAGGGGPITWSVTDGPDNFRVDAETGLVTWLPDTAGLEVVTITADSPFGSDTYSFQIDVLTDPGLPPTAVASIQPRQGDAPLEVTADGSQSFAAPGRAIAFYTWTWGDGSAPEDGAVLPHRYDRPGSYAAHLRVTEAIGSSSETSAVVRVSDDGVLPPAGRIIVSEVNGRDNLEVTFSCDCEAGDAPIVAYLWDFGDGVQSSLPAVTHEFGPGGFTVLLTAVDANGLTATDQVQIRVSDGDNQPPLVVASASPVFGSTPLETNFKATFGDVDGTVSSVSWEFGDGGDSHDAAPAYTYTEPGAYLAVVTVTDDLGLTATGSVEIEVANADGVRPPQILSLPALKASVGKAYQYDEDGTPAARGDRPLTWSLGKKVGTKTVGKPDGMSINKDTGVITWKPTNANGKKEPVTLVAENAAGKVAQDFEIEVAGIKASNGPDEGCGCASSGESRDSAAAGAALVALLGVAIGRRRRR